MNQNVKVMTAEEAVNIVKSGDRIFVGIAANTTVDLCEALWARRDRLQNITLLSGLITKPLSAYVFPEKCDTFRVLSPFLGPVERGAIKVGRQVAYSSIHLSLLDYWLRYIGRPNVAFLAVSRPDENGMVSFGPSGVCAYKHVLENADRVVLEIIDDMPYVTGMDALYPMHEADAVVYSSSKMTSVPDEDADEETKIISSHILELVPDGATIQLGIGGLSGAVGKGLMEKNDLGIYSEMLCNPMIDLIRNGNVTNTKKGFLDGHSVFAFALGNREMYDSLDHNPAFMAAPFPYINDPRNIMKNKNMISINTAMSLNLYGEAAADALGYKQQSAVGGQLDFVKGAQWSEGGKSFIALKSSFMKDGKRESKITMDFPQGTPVTTPRSEIEYVVTEYGCVNLKKLTIQERAKAMISLAHPDFRDELTEKARFHGLIS